MGLSQEKKGDTIGSPEQKDEELISADISPTKGSFFFQPPLPGKEGTPT